MFYLWNFNFSNHKTALHIAVENGNANIVQLLILNPKTEINTKLIWTMLFYIVTKLNIIISFQMHSI